MLSIPDKSLTIRLFFPYTKSKFQDGLIVITGDRQYDQKLEKLISQFEKESSITW